MHGQEGGSVGDIDDEFAHRAMDNFAPSFSAATCSVPCVAHGRTSHGRAGGATIRRTMQQIAMMDTETGEYDEHRLKHSDGEAEKFHRELKLRAVKVRVGWKQLGTGGGSNAS